MKLYSLLAMGVSSMYGNSIIETLGKKVISGGIVFDLVRPIYMFKEYLISDISRVLNRAVSHYIPICIIVYLLFSISFDKIELSGLFPFLLLLFCGYFIMFQFCFLVSMLSAWLINIYNCRFMINQVLRVFSGAIMPLWMWPLSLRRAVLKTPFPYIYSAPISLLIDDNYEFSFSAILKIQVSWQILLLIVNIFIYKKFRKKLCIQGG